MIGDGGENGGNEGEEEEEDWEGVEDCGSAGYFVQAICELGLDGCEIGAWLVCLPAWRDVSFSGGGVHEDS